MTIKEQILQEIIYYPDYQNMDAQLLGVLIDDAEQSIKSYLNYGDETDIPASCSRFVKDLALIRYNKLGTEGITSTNQSGVSESYSDDLPAEMRRQLRRIRKLPVTS